MSDRARERAEETDVIRTFVEVKSSASPYGQEQKQEVLDALAALLTENERRDKRDLKVCSNLDWIIGFLDGCGEYPGLGHARTRLADARAALARDAADTEEQA